MRKLKPVEMKRFPKVGLPKIEMSIIKWMELWIRISGLDKIGSSRTNIKIWHCNLHLCMTTKIILDAPLTGSTFLSQYRHVGVRLDEGIV